MMKSPPAPPPPAPIPTVLLSGFVDCAGDPLPSWKKPFLLGVELVGKLRILAVDAERGEERCGEETLCGRRVGVEVVIVWRRGV